MRVTKPIQKVRRLLFEKAPVEAQLIITRRCNLSCGYCTEFDDVSQPIPLDVLKKRIDVLHRLHVLNIAMLGGEPLLHPDIGEIVAYANRHSQTSITTNGFLISQKIIETLNDAGLYNMQVSIDALHPDPTRYIQKSLKTLAPKLERLKKYAEFDVHVNIVLCEQSKSEFKEMVDELRRLGFVVSVNLVHDDQGMVEVVGEEYLQLWKYHYEHSIVGSLLEYEYGEQLLKGERPRWKCRAGSRFLYVDEYGYAQFCSAQRGRLNKPILEYTKEDLIKYSRTYKGCETGCSLFCVYRDSAVDNAPLHAAKSVYALWRRGVMGKGEVKKKPVTEEIMEAVSE